MTATVRLSFRFLLLSAIALLMLAGCAQESQEPTPAPEATEAFEAAIELVGTSWQLDYLGEDEAAGAALEGVRSTLNFLVGRYLGSAGCNWYQGLYDATGGPLSLKTPGLTSTVCSEPPGVMDQEGLYFGALISVTDYAVDGDKLVLYRDGDQRLLTFSPVEDVSLEGTNWGLKQIYNGNEWFAVALGSEIAAQFDGGGLTGNSGCNDYSASYQVEGAALTVENLAATEMACDVNDDVMDQEQVYLSVLASVAGYEILGGALALLDEGGDPILLFNAQ